MTDANILIVEDERILAEDLKEMLLELGYTVCASVGSGEAAVACAEKEDVDLVLMDIKLDGPMDGVETADILKERFGIPVIYTTAYSDDAILQRAKKTGPLGYIIKPYRASEIKSVIEMAIFKVVLEREHHQAYDDLAERARWHDDRLAEMNAALKVLMEYRNHEKDDVLKRVAKDLNDRITPHFDTIRMRWPNKDLNRLLDMLTRIMGDITGNEKGPLTDKINLTPLESRVADLIRQGRTSKEIARLLGITVRGVTFHRGNIRRKLGIRNQKKNLQTSLSDLGL